MMVKRNKTVKIIPLIIAFLTIVFLGGCSLSSAKVETKNVILNAGSKDFTSLDETFQLSAVVAPENSSNKSITWSSSNNAVASVSIDGLVTPKGEGTAMITARADGGWGVGGCVVRVNLNSGTESGDAVPAAADPVPLKDVNFSIDTFTFKSESDKLTLAPVYEPENTTDRVLAWSSSDEKVATVNNDGVVTPVGMGTAVIKAVSSNKKQVAKCEVIVAFKPSYQKFNSKVTTDGEVRAVWVSTVSCIDFPKQAGMTEKQLKDQITDIINNTSSWGLNTIYFQVRPTADSFYASDVFPSSDFLVKKQGDPLTVDVLKEFITQAHSEGIELHAWINPYRISQVSKAGHDLEKLSENHPARKHPEWVVKYSDGAMYFNPGIPEVQELIVSGVEEIVRNYDVDGIHFDDYFYPTNGSSEFDDTAAYKKYGNGLKLDDWRRKNVDTLVSSVHKAVKAIKPSVQFGISPGGIWAMKSDNELGVAGLSGTSQTYYDNYADSRKWVTEKMVDYICPQIYWQIGHSSAPFKNIAQWWSDLCKNSGVSLYIGIAAYKGDSVDSFKNSNEIKNELEFLNSTAKCDGSVFFTYSSIKNNLAGIADTLKARYSKS